MADPISSAKRGKLAPVYIVVSQQPLLVDRAVKTVLEAAVPPQARGFNLDVFQGKGAAASDILAILQTLPMMAQHRAVFVRDIAAMPAVETAKLIAYLEDPNPSTVFVATASKVDKRIKFYARAKKLGFLVELSAPRRLTSWLRDEAVARDVALSSRAADRLAAVVGKDLSRLALALDQLALYTAASPDDLDGPGGGPIEVDDVDDLIADTRERSVFELTDFIGEGNLPRALASVTSLCDQRQSAIGVVIMLARHIRQLGRCRAALSSGVPASQLARTIGVPPFVADKLAGQARRFSPDDIGRALELLASADSTLKGGTRLTKTLGRELGERVVLDRLVTGLVALAN